MANNPTAASQLTGIPTLEQLNEVLRKSPNDVMALFQRGTLFADKGQIEDARKDADRVLALAGKRPGVRIYSLIARIALLQRDFEKVKRVGRIGLNQVPTWPDLNSFVGAAFSNTGEPKKAVHFYRRAVNLDSSKISYRRALAGALESAGHLDEAENAYRSLFSVDARVGEHTIDFANLLQKREKYEESKELYDQVIKSLPPRPYYFSNKGAVLRKLKRYSEAAESYRKAICMNPSDPGAYYNSGNLWRAIDDLERSLLEYRRALSIAPSNPEYHWNFSLALLASGNLQDGFREYEWRWQYSNFPTRKREFAQPQWQGESLKGKTLLIHAEQGIGDVLQFIRFVPDVVALKEEGTRVILEVHGPLMSLLNKMPGVDEFVERMTDRADFDCHIPLLSLPTILGIKTTAELKQDFPPFEIPEGAPFPIPGLDPEKFKVGFVWGGNPQFSDDKNRSAKIEYFQRLFDMEGVQFICIQKGDREPEIVEAPDSVLRLNERIGDFRDTALAMQQFDLVISTCTSVAHLAGILRRPTWVLLSRSPDWRWLVKRDDSPWYPTARLFRQEHLGDWDGVFDRMKVALEEKVAKFQAAKANSDT